MKVQNSEKTSRTDWERIRNRPPEEIDTSDIPPLDDEFFENAEWRDYSVQGAAQNDAKLRIAPDPDVAAWFQSQSGDPEARMNAALRLYMLAHQEKEQTK